MSGTTPDSPPSRPAGRLFTLTSTLGILAIANAFGFALVFLLFAMWLWCLAALLVGIGGGLALMRFSRRLAAGTTAGR